MRYQGRWAAGRIIGILAVTTVLAVGIGLAPWNPRSSSTITPGQGGGDVQQMPARSTSSEENISPLSTPSSGNSFGRSPSGGSVPPSGRYLPPNNGIP